jgi:hypothetical protein
MLGTLLNTAGIALGGIIGLTARAELSARRQLLLKVVIGVALVWFGLKIALSALTAGDWRYFVRLFLILLASMIAGRILGRLLQIQKGMNHLGRLAKERLSSASRHPRDGFIAAAILFAAAPLGIVGAVEDGLSGNGYHPLVIKGVIDGLAAFSFARMFGWLVIPAALPMALLQLAISTGVRALAPWLHGHQLIDPIHVVCGFLVLYVSLIVFEVKKVELGDYLPAILVAPALAWLLR